MRHVGFVFWKWHERVLPIPLFPIVISPMKTSIPNGLIVWKMLQNHTQKLSLPKFQSFLPAFFFYLSQYT